MKLLPKTKAASLKTESRKLDIDEGVKLAKTVDALRQAKATEEANLAKFRDQSLQLVKTQINTLITEKDDLVRQKESLVYEVELLQKTIDAKWNDAVQKNTVLNTLKNILEDKIQFISETEQEIKRKSADIALEHERIADFKEEQMKTLSSIEKKEEETQQILSETQRERELIIQSLSQRETAFNQKQRDLEYFERDLKGQLEQMDRDRKEIINEKVRLKDREATLERAFARINQS